MTREERIAEAMKRLAAGETYRAVSAETGFSLNMLHRRFAQSGLKRPAPRLRAAPKTVAAAKLMIDQGLSITDACARTGASKGSVSVTRRRLKAGRLPA